MAKKEARRGKNRQSHQHQLNGHSRRKPARRHKDRGNANKTSRAAAIKSELEQVLGVQAIEQVPIGRLQPNPRNVRCHSDRQIEQLVASVQATRHMNPLVVDEAYRVLAGHARLEVAKRTGLGKVPCIRIEHLTEAGKRALALADNRLAELSEWDEALLTAELEELSALDLEFDWEVTGFDTVDLDRLLMPEPNPQMRNGDSHGLSTDPDDDVPSLLGTTPITRHCDIWQCGEHRIGCGDSVDQDGDIYSRVLAGERATQCVSDPPYNVRIFGHVTGMAGFREFSMASGEMSDSQFVGFLTRFLLNAARHCRDGAIFHTFMDWRHLEHLFQAARKAGLALLNLCAWCKPQAGMGSFYRSQHELVAVLKAGQTAHINTFGLGARGRSRSNVWHYPAVRGPRRGVNAPGQGGASNREARLAAD